MKNIKHQTTTTLLIIFVLLQSFANAYYIIDTMADCYACISASDENYVCRNDFNDQVSYCCEDGNDDDMRSCRTNEFCTDEIDDYTMRVVTCPYDYRMCGYPRSTILLEEVNTITYLTLEDRFEYRFADQSICYYEIYVNPTKYNLESADFMITVDFVNIDNVLAQIVNGTDRFTAEGSQKVSVYTGLSYEYTAANNHIFIVLTGDYDDDDLRDPGEFDIEVNFWLDAPEDEAVVIEEESEDGTIKQKTIINGTVTEVVVVWEEPPEKIRIEQEKLTIGLACFMGAIILYCFCCGGKKSNKIQQNKVTTDADKNDVYARTMAILGQHENSSILDETTNKFINDDDKPEKLKKQDDNVKDQSMPSKDGSVIISDDKDKKYRGQDEINSQTIELPEIERPIKLVEESKEEDETPDLNQSSNQPLIKKFNKPKLETEINEENAAQDGLLPSIALSPTGKKMNKLATSPDKMHEMDIEAIESPQAKARNSQFYSFSKQDQEAEYKKKEQEFRQLAKELDIKQDDVEKDIWTEKPEQVKFEDKIDTDVKPAQKESSKDMGEFGTEEHAEKVAMRMQAITQQKRGDDNRKKDIFGNPIVEPAPTIKEEDNIKEESREHTVSELSDEGAEEIKEDDKK